MAKNNLLSTCPYCGGLYYMDEDNDKGYCGRKECAKKAGDLKVVEKKLADGGKIIEFTKTGKEQKVEEEKPHKNKVILKHPIDIEKELKKKNAKRKASTKAKKSTKTRSKKANTRRVSK